MRVVVGDGRKRDEGDATRILCIASAVLFLLLVAGTFFDLPISAAIATAGESPVATVVSTLGLLPMMFPLCVMVGACAERLREAKMRPGPRVAAACACLALVLAAGYVGFSEVFGAEGLGSLLPFAVPMPVRAMGGVLCALAFAGFGYMGAEVNADPALVRRLVLVIATLVVLFALAVVARHFMCRPRYRLVRQGLAGVEYLPWYQRNAAAGKIAAGLGIDGDEFRSFPSGNALQCASLVAAYYGLMAIFPTLRVGWRIVRLAFVPLLLVVMLSRIMLGAHFLSDVAMSGLMVAVATIYLLRAEVRIPAAPARSYLRQV
jgi:membrane-associated phospholipid phosphatase